MLVTSLPRESWPALRLLELYRRRWQVELAFKRLKSLIGLVSVREQGESVESLVMSGDQGGYERLPSCGPKRIGLGMTGAGCGIRAI
jgi:Transposase DDE domain